jgi:excisionase family DNA binding protein
MASKASRSTGTSKEAVFSGVEKLATADELADILRVNVETIRSMARTKKIQGIKIGKSWRFKESDIKRMLDSQKDNSNGGKQEQGLEPIV